MRFLADSSVSIQHVELACMPPLTGSSPLSVAAMFHVEEL